MLKAGRGRWSGTALRFVVTRSFNCFWLGGCKAGFVGDIRPRESRVFVSMGGGFTGEVVTGGGAGVDGAEGALPLKLGMLPLTMCVIAKGKRVATGCCCANACAIPAGSRLRSMLPRLDFFFFLVTSRVLGVSRLWGLGLLMLRL